MHGRQVRAEIMAHMLKHEKKYADLWDYLLPDGAKAENFTKYGAATLRSRQPQGFATAGSMWCRKRKQMKSWSPTTQRKLKETLCSGTMGRTMTG